MKFIFFDFDGVIADSFALALSVNQECFPGLTADEYRRGFEGNINDWVKERIAQGHPMTSIDFPVVYRSRMPQEVNAFPDMVPVVKALARDHTLIVVSSTVSATIKEFAQRYGFDDCFADILGNDVHGSKVEKIKMAMQKYSFGPEACVLITDTLGDVREAEHAGVGVIAVSWGFHDRATLQKDRALTIVDQPDDLPAAINAYFAHL